MNRHATWRLDVARSLASRLHQFPTIEAILVIGSVARNYSDRYSDLELMLVWDSLPPADLQAATRRALAASFRYPSFDPGYSSAFRIDGLAVDIWHTSVAQEEATIHAVLHDYSLELVANNRVDTLGVGIPLRGMDRVHAWQTRIRAYPPELGQRFVDTYLPHFHLRQLQLAARRDNPTAFYHILASIQCSLFLILLALNKRYFPTFKWMYPVLTEFAVGPMHLAARLQQMFTVPPQEAADQLRTVLAQVLDIVEARHPELDTAYARYGLDQEPVAYQAP